MKIAIHHTKNTFSERWIEYFESNHIEYKLVNAYATDIMSEVSDCDAFMWHWHHANPKDVLFARQLIISLEQKGLKTFPDSCTGWHFDDKVGQKYLLEAINAPLVPSYVFYSKESAMAWIGQKGLPLVFKLRGGAGASNVKLIRSMSGARKYVRQAFGRGFAAVDRKALLADSINRFFKKTNKANFILMGKSFARLLMRNKFEAIVGREKGYVYSQDFIPNNAFDTRIIVAGDKAIGLRRYNREGDFRASGSGSFAFDQELFDTRMVEIAFQTSKDLNAQCLAYDFITDGNNNPLIVEISYGFSFKVYDGCPGYWDSNLNWHEERTNIPHVIAADLVKSIKNEKVLN